MDSDRVVDIGREVTPDDRHDKPTSHDDQTTTTLSTMPTQQQVSGEYPITDQLDPDTGEAGVGVGEGELDLEMNINIKQALQRVIEGFGHGAGDMSATLQQQEEYMRRSSGRAGQGDEDVAGTSHGHDDGQHHDHHHQLDEDEDEHGGHDHHHHHHHHHQDRDHDEIQDVMSGDRDNIFQHFGSIDVDTHGEGRSHTPGSNTPRSSGDHHDDQGQGQIHDHDHDHDQDQDQDRDHLHGHTQISNEHDDQGQEGQDDPSGKPGARNPKSTRGTKRKRPAKLKGPIPPVDDDPSRPLTEEEIKRRQNRSRASGRVLPRGNACEFCKRRKLRCDGEKPICTNCLKTQGKRHCVYIQSMPKERKSTSKKNGARVADVESQVSVGSVELTPEIILPDPTELIGEMDQEPIVAGPSGTSEQDGDATGMAVDGTGPSQQSQQQQQQQQQQRETDAFHLAPNLDEIELPAIDMTVAEHHDGFNALFEQSAAAAEADHAIEGDRIHGQGGETDSALGGVYPDADEQGLTRAETQTQSDNIVGISARAGSMGAVDEQLEETPASSSRQTGQEPYLMTLANAAEVASDVPHPDQQGSTSTIPSTGRKRRTRTGSAMPEQDSVWVQIWIDVTAGMQDLGEIDEQVGGSLVGELIDLFYKRAEAFFYTRSLNRLHAALVSGFRPAKCLILAIMGIVATSRFTGLATDMQTLARRLGSQFLAAAQRDFVVSIKYPERIVDAIQAAVLITQVYYTQGKVTEGWLLVTQALRLATLAGMHTLRLDYMDEQVLEQGQEEAVEAEAPQLVTRTQKKPMLFNHVIPKSTILAPSEDTAELGERIHLFWACLMVERTGCLALGCLSSINDEEILTPWPRSIFEYTHITASKVPDETVASFWSSYGRQGEELDEKPKDFWFTTTLKALSLLHGAQRYYDRCVSEPEADHSTRRQQLLETLERFSSDLPTDCVQLPPIIRKRLVDRESIWAGSAIHAVRAILGFADDPLEHLTDMIEACEFVVRLSKAMSVPERPKLDSAIAILWYLTSQHLRGISQVCWTHGKIPETKRANDLVDTLRESMKMLASPRMECWIQDEKLTRPASNDIRGESHH